MAEINLTDDGEENIGVPLTAASVETAKTITAAPRDAVEALRLVGVFAGLPDEQLRWFVEHAEERNLETGDILFRKGDAPDWMLVYLSGEVHLRRDENNLEGYVYIARAGDPATEVSGKLPFSRMTEISANAQAVVPTRVLMFPVTLFPEMLQRMPILAERLVWIMSDRVRETTKQDQQRDKLMALGKLSAGLAHELNNPAAAASRTADELLGMLEELRRSDLNLCRHDLKKEQRKFLADFEAAAIVGGENANNTKPLNALEMSDREDDILTWLENNQVENGWRLAPVLVESVIDVNKLENLTDQIGAVAIADVLARLGAQLSVARMASEIKTSVMRISELVTAIKEYSYMDQAAVQKVNILKGLENILLILKYKLKKKNIRVVREFAHDLPLVTAWGSELNQVWTNLIDNAIDAMPDGGELKVRAKLEPKDVLVEIRDNGAGIPIGLQSRIFEPFFTTKGVGEGTGLGLDTVARVVRQHHGNVRIESKPGETCFQIRLPLRALQNIPNEAGEVKEVGN